MSSLFLFLLIQTAPGAPGANNVLGQYFNNALNMFILPALPFIAAFFVALIGLGYIWAHGNPANQERLRSALGGVAFGVFLTASAVGLVAMLMSAGKVA